MLLKTSKKEQKVKTFTKGKMTIDPFMRDYSKEEFFVRQLEKAKEFLAKHGMPGDDLLPPR